MVEIRDLMRRIRQLERSSPLNNASIGRNGLRVYDGGVITIENGGLKITGTADVIGSLIGSGTITWTGPTNLNGVTVINGDTTVKGPLHVDGATDINGTLAVAGATTLSNDLTVAAPGKITVGAGMSLEPMGAGGGAINFLPSGSISAGLGGTIEIIAPDTTADLSVGAGGIACTLPSTPATGKTPNVWQDQATGKLYRLT